MFDVKAKRDIRRGHIASEWSEPSQTLRTTYRNADFSRSVAISIGLSDSPAVFANGRLSFEVKLPPRGKNCQDDGTVKAPLNDFRCAYSAYPLEKVFSTKFVKSGSPAVAVLKRVCDEVPKPIREIGVGIPSQVIVSVIIFEKQIAPTPL